MWKVGGVTLFLLPNATLPSKTVSQTGSASESSGGLHRHFRDSPSEIQRSSGTHISIQSSGDSDGPAHRWDSISWRTRTGFGTRLPILSVLPNHFIIGGNMLFALNLTLLVVKR